MRHQFPLYEELNKFVESRIHALEVIAPAKSRAGPETSTGKHGKSQTISTHSVSTGKSECSICKRNYILYQCPSFQSNSIANRYELVKQQRRCFNCLTTNRIVKDCKSERRCRECKQAHYTLLHTANKAQLPCDGNSVSTSQSRTSSKTEVTSHLISNNYNSKSTSVLLATARVRIYLSQ